MCTNCRQIWNPYARKKILVRCGKCDACKQEKALKRSVRIRNNVSDSTIALFITLTYTNDYLPYIRKSDLTKTAVEIPVYRNADCRFTYDRHSRLHKFVKTPGTRIIDKVDISALQDRRLGLYHKVTGMDSDCVSVNRFQDFQDFFKRLRINLSRHHNYDKYFSFFQVAEYGGHTYRSHAHALLFIPREDETVFRSAILESWPYADKARTAKFIEIARDAASYVSSYVNSHTDLQPLMSLDKFKQKHSASKNFGCMLDCFQLPKILQKIDSGNLVYNRRVKYDGTTSTVSVPIPCYVLNRYFPKCKGFSWLAASQLRSILLCPSKVGDILTEYSYNCKFNDRLIPVERCTKLENPIYHYTPKETYQIYVRLENCYKRFHKETGLSRYDYALYYERCWSVYYSMLEKMMHDEELQIDYSDFYENANEVVENPAIAPTLSNFKNLTLDPNKRIDIVCKTDHFRTLYSRLSKQKDVTNYVMSLMKLDV